jgi:hypothetical protein
MRIVVSGYMVRDPERLRLEYGRRVARFGYELPNAASTARRNDAGSMAG